MNAPAGTFPPAAAGPLFERLGQRRLAESVCTRDELDAVQWLVDAGFVRRFRDGAEAWLELND